MVYTANHMIRHNGELYYAGDKITLTYADAQQLLKHKAISSPNKPEVETKTEVVKEPEADTKKKK
jgi:hypothetical protein